MAEEPYADRTEPQSFIITQPAVVSGFLSLWTFWPRRFWSTDLRPLRDRYLAAEPEFTSLRLLDTQIDMAQQTGAILRSKAFRLKEAMITLAIAVLLTGQGLGVH